MSSISVVAFTVESLKNVFVHLEKCTIQVPLTCQQWCTVLSGLKDAKKLKELGVYMRDVEVRATDVNSEVTK